MRRKALIVLICILVASTGGGVLAYKAQAENKRILILLYILDALNPDPAKRLCTKPTLTFYTTNEADKEPGSPTIIQNTFYSTAVSASVCPTIPLWLIL